MYLIRAPRADLLDRFHRTSEVDGGGLRSTDSYRPAAVPRRRRWTPWVHGGHNLNRVHQVTPWLPLPAPARLALLSSAGGASSRRLPGARRLLARGAGEHAGLRLGRAVGAESRGVVGDDYPHKSDYFNQPGGK